MKFWCEIVFVILFNFPKINLLCICFNLIIYFMYLLFIQLYYLFNYWNVTPSHWGLPFFFQSDFLQDNKKENKNLPNQL